jgi:hypothetical protein
MSSATDTTQGVALIDQPQAEVTEAQVEATAVEAPIDDDKAQALQAPDTIEANVAEEPEHIRTRMLQWFKDAEDLYGHGSASKAPLYVKHAYEFRELMQLDCARKGKDWKRKDFMDRFTLLISRASYIPTGSLDPHKLAKAVGVCEMLRATGDDPKRLVMPNARPEAESSFFGGVFTWPAIRALGKLVKIEKDPNTVDTYTWAEEGYAQIAKDIHRKLRSGIMHSSRQAVTEMINAEVRRVEEANKAVTLAKMDPAQLEQHERNEAARVEEKQNAQFGKLRDELAQFATSTMKMDGDNIRDRLVRAGTIPPATSKDVAQAMKDPAMRPVIASAMVMADVSVEEFASMFGNISNRVHAIKALAQVMTHQDVATLMNELREMHLVTPITKDRNIPDLINAIGAGASKLKNSLNGKPAKVA